MTAMPSKKMATVAKTDDVALSMIRVMRYLQRIVKAIVGTEPLT
jgi:hypothetical protein